MTFWAASGFLWQHLASFIKNKIKQSKNKAICYHILIFTVLKEQRVASSQKIHQGRCFTFIKGQRDNCLFSKMNLPVLYIPCIFWWVCCPVQYWLRPGGQSIKRRVEQTLFTILLFARHCWCVTIKRTCIRLIFFTALTVATNICSTSLHNLKINNKFPKIDKISETSRKLRRQRIL